MEDERKGCVMSINRVEISGNLTRDPEIKSTSSGAVVLDMSVAVSDRRKNQRTGEWEDSPNYIDCAMFGKRAEAVSRYLSKGTKVFLAGRLRYDSWTAQDGTKRQRVSVVADDIEFAAPSRDLQRPHTTDALAGRETWTARDAYASEVADRDIPF